MSILKLSIKSFIHYFSKNLTIAFGVAISTAVITGGLIVGDSVNHSLRQTVHYRLGNITHAISAGDRYFTKGYASQIAQKLDVPATAMLKLEGIGITEGGKLRINNVQVLGIDNAFAKTTGTDFHYDSLGRNEVIISENMADRLNLAPDDYLMLRIKKASVIPLNTPFVSDEEQTVSVRAKVKAIAEKTHLGRFTIQNSQTAPFNVFMDIDRLNEVMEMKGRINNIFLNNTRNHETFEMSNAIRSLWQLEDGNFELRYLDKPNVWEFYSKRVFIDGTVSEGVLNDFENVKPVLTYFVNSFEFNGNETPYSFISTLDDSLVGRDEVIINEWLAHDLAVSTGDTLRITYFTIGPLRQLEEKERLLMVKEIVPIDGIFWDPSLMPFIPGLSDAGSCSEWETGIPVKLNKIRDKDEKYWDDYRGTPKAFINTSLGLELWKNRFGNYTAFRFDANKYSREELQKKLSNTIDPEDLNLQLLKVKEEGMYAAQHGVDFGQLFISLSFFVLLSGVILTVLLFIFHASQRRDQIGTLSAMGFGKGKITAFFMLESLASAILGSILGIFLALAYTHLVFFGLSRVWTDIVRTTILEINIVPGTLIIGAAASLSVSVLSLYFTIRRLTKKEVIGLQKKTVHVTSSKKIKRIRLSFLVTLMLGISFIVIQLLSSEILNPALFFIAGIILMVSFFLFFMIYLDKLQRKTHLKITLKNLGTKNLLRNKGRSLSVFILLCIGSFLVISTGINRKDFSKTAVDKSSGTGGFLFMAESTVPVLKDLNDPKIAQEFGFSEDYDFVQFRTQEGDDASCLNLNRIRNPRILGVEPQELDGRFTFQTKTEFLDPDKPWESLQSKIGNAVPAIADQTVIQWGLGKKVGDTLVYKNAMGKDLELLLIGGLAGSIFQGNVIISNTFFLENFPTSSGSKVFLIDGKPSKDSTMTAELNMLFRDYGWSMERSIDKLMEFKTVENTYLTIFLVMGALGLLLGTIGAAIVLARNIQDRKREIALLLATGYKRTHIVRMLLRENSILLFAGLAGGLVAAIIATLPSVMANFYALPLTFLFLSLVVIVLNGLVWIFIISYVQMFNIKEIRVLRNE